MYEISNRLVDVLGWQQCMVQVVGHHQKGPLGLRSWLAVVYQGQEST